MAGAAAGMSFRGPAASSTFQFQFQSRLPSPLHSSFQDFLSYRTESGSMPSCVSYAVPSCPSMTLPQWNYQASLLPSSVCSSSATSWSCSTFINAGNMKIGGLSTGLNGEFGQDLRRAAKRSTASTKARSMSGQSAGVLEETIKEKNSLHAVVVYSKSWCPYCSMVKGLFTKLAVPFDLVELDQLEDEQEVQEALGRLTGQSTVPSVFVGGKHIGGCDDTMALHQRGELIPAIEAAGLKITPT